MAISSIDEEQVLNALHSLEFDLWPEVIRYIQILKDQPQKKQLQPSLTISAADLANSEIVGLWQERQDITDSVSFARQLRSDAEQQRRSRYVSG